MLIHSLFNVAKPYMIPSAPVNEDALTSYETVYHYLPPQIKNAQKKTEDWKHP